MTPQEQELIGQLFERLRQTPAQPQDRDAAELIRRSIAEQPDAPYKLVQTVLIQDMALTQAQARMAELERRLAETGTATQAAPRGGSFLPQAPAARGGVPSAGPWGRSEAQAAPPPYADQRQPWGGPQTTAPQTAAAAPGMMAGGGSGFLRAAAATALGVVGGQMLFQGIQSMFGHSAGSLLAGQSVQPSLSETVVNNYYGDSGAALRDADVSQAADREATVADSGDAALDPGVGDTSDDQIASADDWGDDSDLA